MLSKILLSLILLCSTAFAVESPQKIDDDGNYFYDTDSVKKTGPLNTSLGKVDVERDGAYNFNPITDSSNTKSKAPGSMKPQTIRANGDYLYKAERSPQTASFSFKFGKTNFSKLGDRGVTYNDYYGKNSFSIFVDFEKQYYTKAGQFGLKISTGLINSSANGVFKSTPSLEALEKYNFFGAPLLFKGSMRFQYSDKQWLVPEIDIGAGAIFFAEIRDDSERTKKGYGPVVLGSGSLNFKLDGLDNFGIYQLDNDLGINHMWLSLELELMKGLSEKYDFTSSIVLVGFLFDY